MIVRTITVNLSVAFVWVI